jgi:hypothetical protein
MSSAVSEDGEIWGHPDKCSKRYDSGTESMAEEKDATSGMGIEGVEGDTLDDEDETLSDLR